MSVPDHLAAVVRNAHALASRGDLRGAQVKLEQALDPAAATLGADHPEVLAGTRLLASLHRELGDLMHARRLLEEALAAGQFTLGEDSPALLPLSYDLATLADELGNRHEARRNFTTVLRHGPAALGPDHEYVQAASSYLGASPPGTAGPAAPPPPTELPVPRTDAPVPRAETPVPRAETPVPPPATGPFPPPSAPRPVPPLPAPEVAPSWPPRNTDEHRHSRLPMLVLVLVAAMALVGGGVAALLVLNAPDRREGGRPQPSPTADALRAPGDLKLRDDGTSVTLTWTDPTNGSVPFVIAGGRPESGYKTLGSAGSGETTYTINGLSTSATYCFLVAAVYSPQQTAPSSLTCTRRGPSASPRR
ncbi:fibronectin type III domain-containing protein [Planosporangium flavigriseum]|uniref:fibronectin type III domain-containing protein n=1 Tax=Planosporangium flavigriseum TaxID=373681 RepID=UPI001EF38A7B|nr:tetratricopeptide repeat protein [Planosporangium flavigriseum]